MTLCAAISPLPVYLSGQGKVEKVFPLFMPTGEMLMNNKECDLNKDKGGKKEETTGT